MEWELIVTPENTFDSCSGLALNLLFIFILPLRGTVEQVGSRGPYGLACMCASHTFVHG